jgi:hypothetical protein
MSVLKVAVASIIALSLVLGLALPALAGTEETLPWADDFQLRVVKGTVTGVDQENQAYFKVQSGEDEIAIRVDENTRYFLLDVQRPITALLQQFRIQNQEQAGAAGEQALRLRIQNQLEVNAQDEPGNGLKKRVRAGVSVSNQARLRVQNRVAQTESVPVEPQPARLRVQEQLVQTVTLPLPEPQPVSRPLGDKAEFSDIEVGDRVVVWLANGENLAKVVLIAKPVTRIHVSGVITEVTSETITISPEDGEAVTLRYNQEMVFVLNGFIAVEERQLARAVYDSEHMLAKKVVVYLPGN